MQKWIEQLDLTTLGFQESFIIMTHDQLNWKPNSTTWSIAQNIDHLIVINRSYFPIIKAIREGKYKTPFLGKIGVIVSLIGKSILQGVQPDRKNKSKTFPIWEPAESEIPPGILQRFEKHQRELKEVIKSAQDLVDKGVVISSPANRNIVYKLETAFDIIVAHESRHLEQAKEVQNLLIKEYSAWK